MAEAIAPEINAIDKTSKWTRIKEMFAEMDSLHAKMKEDQKEIERLSVKTRASLAEIETILNRISAS